MHLPETPESATVFLFTGVIEAKRRMMAIQVPDELLQPVIEVFEPEKVILFGSRARGDETDDSDYDLLVIVADDAPPERLGLEARRRARRLYRRAADIIPCRRSVFEGKAALPGSFAHAIASQGMVVYERR